MTTSDKKKTIKRIESVELKIIVGAYTEIGESAEFDI